nr:MAG TPA: hypothetical protein [Caudoviricetes sp.]
MHFEAITLSTTTKFEDFPLILHTFIYKVDLLIKLSFHKHSL